MDFKEEGGNAKNGKLQRGTGKFDWKSRWVNFKKSSTGGYSFFQEKLKDVLCFFFQLLWSERKIARSLTIFLLTGGSLMLHAFSCIRHLFL